MSGAIGSGARAGLAAVATHLGNPALRAAFAIGFLILFVFIGVFTYVNFVLVLPPIGLGMMQLGWVYLVFLPSLPTTLVAGSIAARIGARPALAGFLGLALLGLPMLVAGSITIVLAGLALVAVGTFGAQAIATGYVGAAARSGRGAASGLYLSSYFAGGLIGSIVLGRLFEYGGWNGAVIGIGVALALAGAIAVRLRDPMTSP
jgi:predicted MFS family arabinose efflux permease